MKKTKTRILAEKIQSITGESLLSIQTAASHLLRTGLVKTREEALKELLSCAQECH